MRIVARAEWGARHPKTAPQIVSIATRSATCVHHDGATPITVTTFEVACERVRADQNYHMDHNGWADIGYNYLVISAPGTPVDGLIFEGRGRDAVGAHCLNWNTPWIGVQVAIGGDQHPSPAALTSVLWLHETFVGAAGHTLAMKGHKDGFNTACPGPELYAWVLAYRSVVSGTPTPHAAPPTSAPKPPTPTPTGGLHVNIIDLRAASTSHLVTGPGVRPMQRLLSTNADGKGGPGTRAALGTAQVRIFGTADYQFGPKTAEALLAGK